MLWISSDSLIQHECAVKRLLEAIYEQHTRSGPHTGNSSQLLSDANGGNAKVSAIELLTQRFKKI
jgi:hypothetical protein